MTTGETLDRLAHFYAGMADQWQREREENRQLCRDSQRRLDTLAIIVAETKMSVARLAGVVTRLGEEMREADKQLAERMREGDERLGSTD